MINKIVYIIYRDIVFIISVLHFHYSSDWLHGNTHIVVLVDNTTSFTTKIVPFHQR